jgi:poly-beta-1,6 N-acetyl-D-glucosamine synthase
MYRPSVSVLIAAFNERPVIVRTILSILKNDYSPLEVVVIDDGSSDGTADEVRRLFSSDSRVKVLCQRNMGKASALNNGLNASSGEILVCLDADTQIGPKTIQLLVRHFADPKIGTVAGNIKVGNRVNLLTSWQSIEYITSQNLDRRAFALLNAITVIPGAVGAWRRSAVLEAGGYLTDTLAEDMDLTWRLRQEGWKLAIDSDAIAYTEAPDNLRALFKQRFRWAYGTLQCLWKHRRALFKYGWFGWLALPSLWVFQILFQVLAPLIDLTVLYNLLGVVAALAMKILYRQDWQPFNQAVVNLRQVGFFYALFFIIELNSAAIAFKIDKERLKPLWWLFWQRFVYRQLMYVVIWRSLWTALKGITRGWGKVERKGTVKVSEGLKWLY